ncbi:DDE-type integrase/transposase/recombinase [Pseudarthrobacter sp. NamE5]|uniref:DDE-type integrase/transposase/recombinase n=1 Tax=Pseudarthrobacter sp. NamE5 TaxID=2576839 RepID=UPI00110C091D|nr:DDE-type integrase/transposase/recombinase [Pseudarthrobacter sp. NamE5]TLM80869.1 IS30 family transposase [Pseudarthrobacter sp. NamE5]
MTIIEALGVLPATLRRTLTWDRGSEMAKHAEVTAALGTLVYFCDPASPWQRASNENANGLLEQAEVRFAADEINGRPRAVLNWDSAAARFASLTIAALSTKAVSKGIGKTTRLPTAGDNSIRFPTATATKELPQRLPIPAVENPIDPNHGQ